MSLKSLPEKSRKFFRDFKMVTIFYTEGIPNCLSLQTQVFTKNSNEKISGAILFRIYPDRIEIDRFYPKYNAKGYLLTGYGDIILASHLTQLPSKSVQIPKCSPAFQQFLKRRFGFLAFKFPDEDFAIGQPQFNTSDWRSLFRDHQMVLSKPFHYDYRQPANMIDLSAGAAIQTLVHETLENLIEETTSYSTA